MPKEKFKILFELGNDSRNNDQWLDYLQYGFDEDDVPELLRLVGDEALHQADIDGNEAWVPMHAWRALGQIGSPAAIEPLLGMFDEIVEDDWALSEFPIVMSMIGEQSIEALTCYLRESNHDEFSCVMAADALKTIAQSYPACRERVILVLSTYLDAPDPTMPTLSGLIVLFLIELDATSSINTLRRLYESKQVDISCAGDLEDVEIALGMRERRTTPAPSYAEDGVEEAENTIPQEPKRIKRPKTDDVFVLLTYYIERFGNEDSVLDVSELDGFFAALNCSPQNIAPAIWLPAIWGGVEPKWPNKTSYEEFTHLSFTHYHHVMESLEANEFHGIFLERDQDDEVITIVDEWCSGFLRGLDIWPKISEQDSTKIEEILPLFHLFTTEEGWEKVDNLSSVALKEEQDKISPTIQSLFEYFKEQREKEKTPIRRETAKINRNAPCPCGSGKKYKKCCLN